MLHNDMGRLIEIEDRRDWSAAALEAYCGLKVYFVLWAALSPLHYHERSAKARGRWRALAWKDFSERYLHGEPVGVFLARLQKTTDLSEATTLKAQVLAEAELNARRNGMSLDQEITRFIAGRDRRMAAPMESAA